MKQVIAILVLLFVCAAFGSQRVFRDGKIMNLDDVPAINPKLVNYINNKKTSWEAHNHKLWVGWSLKDVQKLLGAHMYTWTDDDARISHPESVVRALPPSFDSRAKWPKCTSIGTILNQAKCGSCWAFGAVESITDRFCIESNATMTAPLSEEDLVACDYGQDGCDGGDPLSAWQWVEQVGLVTASCDPYTVPTCPPEDQPCLKFVPTPACVQKCVNSEQWTQTKHYVKSAYYVSSQPEQIAAEIVQNGPVEAAFSVYEDFIHYKSGVYQHKTGGYLGGHAIKIIGYGVENTLPYWLVANSWTTTWGDKGFFKILKGQDECGIESGVVGGAPKIN